MLYIKAFHIIFMVCWFAGIFYLPRLFVYHTQTVDVISSERFKVMERRLYYGISTPSAVLTTIFGLWLLSYNVSGYLHAPWMHAKLGLVMLLWIYQLYCGHLVAIFARNANRRSTTFYRWFNELPVLVLVAVVILVVVKPTFGISS